MSNSTPAPGPVRHTLRWTRTFGWLVAAELASLLIGGLLIYFLHRGGLGPYVITIGLPAATALAGVCFLLVRSPYTRLAVDLGSQRTEKGPGVLGIVMSDKGRILLNRQKEDPWEGLWVVLGGYHSDEQEAFSDVATRRVRELTDCSVLRFKARDQIATVLASDPGYMGDSIDAGHAPIDVYAFWITDESNGRIPEGAITPTKDLKWWDLDELEQAGGLVPFHHRDLLHGILSKRANSTAYEYWDVDSRMLETMLS